MLATETSLLPSLRLLLLDRYRVGSEGWDLVDQVLKKDKTAENKKVRREGGGEGGREEVCCSRFSDDCNNSTIGFPLVLSLSHLLHLSPFLHKKGNATGSIPSKRMLIESVRVHSSLAFLTSLNLRETGIRTVSPFFTLVVKCSNYQ